MRCAKRKVANEIKSVKFHHINLHMNFNIMPKGGKQLMKNKDWKISWYLVPDFNINTWKGLLNITCKVFHIKMLRCWWTCTIRVNSGDFREQIRNINWSGTELELTSYIKLATFSKCRNSKGRSFPIRKKRIACFFAWLKYIRRRSPFWRIRI